MSQFITAVPLRLPVGTKVVVMPIGSPVVVMLRVPSGICIRIASGKCYWIRPDWVKAKL